MKTAKQTPRTDSLPLGKVEGRELLSLTLDKIDPNPRNARSDAETELQGLQESINEAGMIQPPIVRRKADGRYEVVAGDRRRLAAIAAGYKRMDCIVRELSDAEALVHSLLENMQRRSLNPIDKARGLALLCTPLEQGGAGKTQTAAARLCGHEAPWAASLLGLLRLPERWQQRIASGELPEHKAKLLVAHADNAALLAAIEQDMESSPWAWETRDAFQQSLTIFSSRSDLATQREGMHKGRPPAPRLPPVQAEPAAKDDPTTFTIVGKRSDRMSPCDVICDAIATLSDLPTLRAIKEAVDLRITHLTRRMKTLTTD